MNHLKSVSGPLFHFRKLLWAFRWVYLIEKDRETERKREIEREYNERERERKRERKKERKRERETEGEYYVREGGLNV